MTECNTLLVEGAEADDIAAFLVRTFLDSPLPGDSATPVISNRHVVLLTADGDWLQYMEHPHVHCVDVLGALRRPEWLQVRSVDVLVCVASQTGPQVRCPCRFGPLSTPTLPPRPRAGSSRRPHGVLCGYRCNPASAAK